MRRKYRSAVGCLSAAAMMLPLAVATSFATDTAAQAEIDALKQQLNQLQARVERLEAQWQQGVPVNPALDVQPVPGGWRKAANWQMLDEGMPAHRVYEILGEPQRQRTVRKFELLEYGDGVVRLYLGRLKSWEVAHGLDAD